MRAKIGYMAILVLMGFLYLWTNVAVTFYLFFGLLLFAILSFLLNWYAARHLTMHLQVNQDLNQVSTILIYVKNTGIYCSRFFWYLWVPRKKSRSVGLLCVSGWSG